MFHRPYDQQTETRLEVCSVCFLLVVGAFDESRYWDVFVEYSKNTPTDILIEITAANRGPETARVHVLPTLWYRNTWCWTRHHKPCTGVHGSKSEVQPRKPALIQTAPGVVECHHNTLGNYVFRVNCEQEGFTQELLFTENETNYKVTQRRIINARFSMCVEYRARFNLCCFCEV